MSTTFAKTCSSHNPQKKIGWCLSILAATVIFRDIWLNTVFDIHVFLKFSFLFGSVVEKEKKIKKLCSRQQFSEMHKCISVKIHVEAAAETGVV